MSDKTFSVNGTQHMKNQFDILDFGAVADGITDSTAAVQAALDAAADCFGTVLVPPGRYAVGKLRMHGQGVSLVGQSAWSFRRDGASIFELNDPTADCLLDISGAFGVTVSGMCLNGKDLGERVHGIKLWWPEYNGGGEEDTPTIEDCRIGCFSGDGLHFEHVWCFSVRHSMLHRCGGAGLYLDGWDGFILDNWFSGNRNGGLLGGPMVASVTCTGNRVEWNRRGGFILPNGNSYNINGNFFDRSFGPALELGSNNGKVNTAAVVGNIFRRSGARQEGEAFAIPEHSCHVWMRNCDGVSLANNSMRVGKNDDGKGILSPDFGLIIENCRTCTVQGNTMFNGALQENLIVRGTHSGCLIEGNTGTIYEP